MLEICFKSCDGLQAAVAGSKAQAVHLPAALPCLASFRAVLSEAR